MSKSKSNLEEPIRETRNSSRKRKADMDELLQEQEKKIKKLESSINSLTKQCSNFNNAQKTKTKKINNINKEVSELRDFFDGELDYINKKIIQLDRQVIEMKDYDDYSDIKDENNEVINSDDDEEYIYEDKLYNNFIEDLQNNEPIRRRSKRKKNRGEDEDMGEDEDGDENSNDDINQIYLDTVKIMEENIFKQSLRDITPIAYAKDIYKGKDMKDSQKNREMKLVETYIELTKQKNSVSNLDYFINLEPIQKIDIINKLQLINNQNNDLTPLFFKVINSGLDEYTKNIVLQKIETLSSMEVGAGEYHKLNNWITSVLSVPWNKYSELSVKNTDQPEDIYKFLKSAKDNMDSVIYGQNDTKNQIIQIISKMISNPEKAGNVFAIYGAPGTGKTTIVKEGMSKALGIPFNFISLGGATDSSYLEGHHYTYEGSTSGKIVDSLKKCGCMNPVFYFDELDKVSKTNKGEEIINMLIHMTDPSQNNLFQDKYFSGINFDISKAIFVFSFNNMELINKILLDRMELIEVDNFKMDEKRVIVKDYLLPKLYKTYNISSEKINFSEEIIDYIIDFKGCQKNEKGIRNVIRRFENIISKLNIVLITGKNADDIHTSLKNIKTDSLPINVDKEIVDKLVTKRSNTNNPPPPVGMYS